MSSEEDRRRSKYARYAVIGESRYLKEELLCWHEPDAEPGKDCAWLTLVDNTDARKTATVPLELADVLMLRDWLHAIARPMEHGGRQRPHPKRRAA